MNPLNYIKNATDVCESKLTGSKEYVKGLFDNINIDTLEYHTTVYSDQIYFDLNIVGSSDNRSGTVHYKDNKELIYEPRGRLTKDMVKVVLKFMEEVEKIEV